MELLKNIFDYVGYVSTLIVFVSAIAAVVLWIRGIAPALLRLGHGLSRRKIAIFAKGDMYNSLESLLCDSKLFNKANFLRISTERDIGIAEDATLFLVYWPDWKELEKILKHKADGTAMIVYAPQDQGKIPSEKMEPLDKYRNVIVSNLRGRLLNDIFVSLITTSYEKKSV